MRRLLIALAAAASTVSAACPWDGQPTLSAPLNGACVCGGDEGGRQSVGCSGPSANFTALALALQATAQSTVIGELSVTNATVPALPDFVFRGLKIISLRLSDCQLSSISSQAFRGLENTLQTLDLSGNKLSGSMDGVVAALRPMRLVSTMDLSRKCMSFMQH